MWYRRGLKTKENNRNWKRSHVEQQGNSEEKENKPRDKNMEMKMWEH